MTGYVTTRYWRAPEILLQWMHYGEKGILYARQEPLIIINCMWVWSHLYS